MSLGLSLGNALSGLRLNQQSISVLSQNISNANTEGYSRQTVEQSAVYVEGIGSGVRFDGVSRKVDKYLQRAVQDNSASMNSAAVLSDYAARVQVLLGAPGSENSIDAYSTTFFNALQSLAETPERTSFRSTAVQAASALAREVSQLARNLHGLRRQADSDIVDAVSSINTLIKKIDAINASLARSQALGQSNAGLFDQRDIALRELSALVDISVFHSSTGQVNVFTADGVALVDGNRHEVSYLPLSSDEAFIQGQAFNPIYVATLNADGAMIGAAQQMVSGGISEEVSTKLKGGKIYGLLQMRDTLLPETLAQLDMFASRLRDEVNRIHNQGAPFPPPFSLTGTRAVKATDALNWSGTLRVAALTSDGTPVPSRYADETETGIRPLTLNLGELDSGLGQGKPTLQAIIDEINMHFGAPQPRVKLGPLNDIRLTSNNDLLPNASPPTFNFDFDVENISGGLGKMFVTGVTVLNDVGTDISSVTNTAPLVNLSTTNTFDVLAGQDYFTVEVSGSMPTLAVGDMVYLPDPGTLPGTIGGIASSNYVGYLEVQAISGSQITLRLPPLVFSNNAETVSVTGATLIPPYDTILSGEKVRTNAQGTFTADLSGDPASAYYDIAVDIGVIDEDGNLSTSTVTYRVTNETEGLRNLRYAPTGATGDGVRVIPSSSQSALRAIMVDEDGNEIAKINGKYIDQAGFLSIVANNESYGIAVDSLDSRERGDAANSSLEEGSNRSFSHFFELNNFFASNDPDATGDALDGSAIALALEERIGRNPNLISTGGITQSRAPADPSLAPLYTYERNSGNNAVVQALAALSASSVSFEAAGGIARTSLSLTSYIGEVIGYVSAQAAAAETTFSNAETLYDGFKSRLESITGVNLDEELANTIIYQNAYSASARIIKLVDELFTDLIGIL